MQQTSARSAALTRLPPLNAVLDEPAAQSVLSALERPLSPGPVVTADDVAALIAARLIASDGPVTGVFAALLRREIRLNTIGPHLRPPDPAEDVPDSLCCWLADASRGR